MGRSFCVSMVVRAVLLDIEGTTTPITFVTEVLFPYVRREVKEYLRKRWEESEVQGDVEALRQQSIKDQSDDSLTVSRIIDSGDKEDIIASVVKNVEEQMDLDRKITPLKQLQGHMWKFGYQSGELQGVVYDDVLEAFKKWKEMEIPIYIYSSGSVGAQKLLFGNSTHGDLLPYISGHFDTTIGLKVESASYKKICENIKLNPSEVLFVTDSLKELQAAVQENLKLRLSIRPGNAPVEDKQFTAIHSFNELFNCSDINYKS